jgi:hypothetical protein
LCILVLPAISWRLVSLVVSDSQAAGIAGLCAIVPRVRPCVLSGCASGRPSVCAWVAPVRY